MEKIPANGKQFGIKLIVFDLDGTLIDSKPDIVDAVNTTLTHFGIEKIPPDVVQQFVGTGVAPLILQKVREKDPGLVPQVATAFENTYEAMCLNQTTVYPGVIDTLQEFATKPKVILTNKRSRFVPRILEGLGLSKFFIAAFGAECLGVRKPDPLTMLKICSEQGVLPAEALIVGDTETDLKTGQAAGCLTCAVTYGYGDPQILKNMNPDIVVSDMRALKSILI